MNTATASAFSAFLSTLTSEQRIALMNVTSMHIENEEDSDAAADGDPDGVLETEGHLFLVALRDATTAAIAA